MKKTVVVLIIAFVFSLMLNAGCQEEQNLSNDKRSRLIAAENLELKKDLEKCRTELKQQKQLFQSSQKESKKQSEDMLVQLMNLNSKLRKENKELKAQLEEVKKQLGKE
jgi:hypothetical protein